MEIDIKKVHFSGFIRNRFKIQSKFIKLYLLYSCANWISWADREYANIYELHEKSLHDIEDINNSGLVNISDDFIELIHSFDRNDSKFRKFMKPKATISNETLYELVQELCLINHDIVKMFVIEYLKESIPRDENDSNYEVHKIYEQYLIRSIFDRYSFKIDVDDKPSVRIMKDAIICALDTLIGNYPLMNDDERTYYVDEIKRITRSMKKVNNCTHEEDFDYNILYEQVRFLKYCIETKNIERFYYTLNVIYQQVKW